MSQKHISVVAKLILGLVFSTLSVATYAQDKYSYVYFNKMTEVTGTEYVIASIYDMGKTFMARDPRLLFINTKNGHTKQVEFPGGGYWHSITQVRIDSLQINRIVLEAQTVDLDHRKGISWTDPTQLVVISPDGEEKVQLTEDSFFVRTWIVNNQTGTVTVTGHYDTNDNGKYDKTDKTRS
ncbi:hypothetical protein [Chitinophaga pinensis]|uniref:Uncharacterized protein n=1 Tax=Chitinophaga pinensis TaxID=79329 RepID=A0A5C6LVT1_9BACT|nr:hypothetical protein [Chitinophaga pinensis]TWW00844.1 hypothetical protein FEF09_10150 [Chitinophaga pinensis]